MNTIYIQKLLNYVQKNYDDLQYDKGLFHWLIKLSGFLSFALPVYLFATDQANLLAIIFLCVSPIGLFFGYLTETKQKSLFWREVSTFFAFNFMIFFISTAIAVMAMADKIEMEEKIKTTKETNHD
jgi:Zn-dependent protease with chaperone function